MNIDQMQQAGREMDALVAERVMGWRIHRRNTAWWVKAEEENENTLNIMAWACGKDKWSPSTDIAAAWKVEEKLMELDKILEYLEALQVEANGTEKGLTLTNKIIGYTYNFEEIFNLIHATPAQRCRAALKALGVSS